MPNSPAGLAARKSFLQFRRPYRIPFAGDIYQAGQNARACRAVNRKKFFALLGPVDSRIHGATNQTEHLVHGTDPSGSRSEFLTAYPHPVSHPPPSVSTLPLSPLAWQPRRLPRHSFPFYPSRASARQRRRKIPEIFLDFPKPRTEKSPSTSIAERRDVECVNTRVENAGMRRTSRRINRATKSHLLKFSISVLLSSRISRLINDSWKSFPQVWTLASAGTIIKWRTRSSKRIKSNVGMPFIIYSNDFMAWSLSHKYVLCFIDSRLLSHNWKEVPIRVRLQI